MGFGTKLALFIYAAVLLELIPLELILRSTENDLATGQLIGVFVAIAVLSCMIVGVAIYRHFQTTKSILKNHFFRIDYLAFRNVNADRDVPEDSA